MWYSPVFRYVIFCVAFVFVFIHSCKFYIVVEWSCIIAEWFWLICFRVQLICVVDYIVIFVHKYYAFVFFTCCCQLVFCWYEFSRQIWSSYFSIYICQNVNLGSCSCLAYCLLVGGQLLLKSLGVVNCCAAHALECMFQTVVYSACDSQYVTLSQLCMGWISHVFRFFEQNNSSRTLHYILSLLFVNGGILEW